METFTEAEIRFLCGRHTTEFRDHVTTLAEPIRDLRELGMPTDMWMRQIEQRAKKLHARLCDFRQSVKHQEYAIRQSMKETTTATLDTQIETTRLF
jgi:hypothetical protein